MFGFFKKPIKPSLVSFLDRADDAYILAFKSHNIQPFTPFASNALCNRVLEHVLDGSERNFGVDRYRVRTWEIQSKSSTSMTVLKEVTHKNISIGRGIEIPLAEDTSQVWFLNVLGNNKYEITNMEPI